MNVPAIVEASIPLAASVAVIWYGYVRPLSPPKMLDDVTRLDDVLPVGQHGYPAIVIARAECGL